MSLPDPNAYPSVGWIMVALGGASLALNQTVSLIRNFTRGSDEYANKASYEGHRTANTAAHQDFQTRITRAESDIAMLKERTETTNGRLEGIESKIDRLIAKTGA